MSKPETTVISQDDKIEVVVRLPNAETRVFLTIDVVPGLPPSVEAEVESLEPAEGEGPAVADQRVPRWQLSRQRNWDWANRGGFQREQARTTSSRKLAGGRTLPKLLFVTDFERLVANIGREEARDVIRLIDENNQSVYQIENRDQLFSKVAAKAGKDGYQGVVLVGGYDVIPPARLDCLSPTLRRDARQELINQGTANPDKFDSDEFIVWSDDPFGDTDGNGDPDLPVSRIPDAKSAEMVMTGLLGRPTGRGRSRFGERNSERPFADGVYSLIEAQQSMLISAPTLTQNVQSAAVGAELVYIMLHGSYQNTSKFWGEDWTSGKAKMVEGFSVSNVPELCDSVVLAGCCWGALAFLPRALEYRGDSTPITPIQPAQSIALSFLKAGARAYVGCTGTHYSPGPAGGAGEPIHREFWQQIVNGSSPANALFNAKRAYLKWIRTKKTSKINEAIEAKLLREFTCLGLGW